MIIRRTTFRLYPTATQEKQLYEWRRMHKDLYNAAICNRKTQYERFVRSVDYFEQQNCLPAFKEVWPEYKELGSHALQATLKRVDAAYQRFFNGLGGYPKFKSIRHYSGWTYPDRAGWKAHTIGDNGYLELSNLGQIQMSLRPAPAFQKAGAKRSEKSQNMGESNYLHHCPSTRQMVCQYYYKL